MNMTRLLKSTPFRIICISVAAVAIFGGLLTWHLLQPKFHDVTLELGQPLPSAGDFQNKLARNLLTIARGKNLALARRIFHPSSKSIRGRLLSYLSFQAAQSGSREFDISFNRQQLADYLSVDRSALSNERGKMQREGLLCVQRNHFLLLDASEAL